MISTPTLPAGESDSLVELVDLFPTLAELAGLPTPKSVQGKSLLPILKDPDAEVKSHALSFHQGHSLRNNAWHYMRYRDGSRELYDMKRDEGEFDNLADDDNYQNIVSQLDRELDRSLREKGLAD